LHLSPNHNHALQYLEYGIEHNTDIILLSGEVGAGKTTLIQYMRRQIDQNIGLVILSNTNLVADQLLIYILMELKIEPDQTSKGHNLSFICQ
jgi:general secretion pathway protein A